MKRRLLSMGFYLFLGFIIIVLCYYIWNPSARFEAGVESGFEAGVRQGIETGRLYDTVLLYVTSGSISTDELAEIDELRDMYYNNPTTDNAIEWHNKMAEIVNSKK